MILIHSSDVVRQQHLWLFHVQFLVTPESLIVLLPVTV